MMQIGMIVGFATTTANWLLVKWGVRRHVNPVRPRQKRRATAQNERRTSMNPILAGDFLYAAVAAGVLPILPGSCAPHRPLRSARCRNNACSSEMAGRQVFGLPSGWLAGIRLSAVSASACNSPMRRAADHCPLAGQLPAWTQDGFPWPQTPTIANGDVQAYDYTAIPGTYWMHSHQACRSRLMSAPIRS